MAMDEPPPRSRLTGETPDGEHLSVVAAARRLGITRQTFMLRVWRGEIIPVVTTRHGPLRFTVAEIDARAGG